jgi:hypothetical protein
LWGWVRAFVRSEGELFPGVTILVLLLAGVFMPRAEAVAAPATTSGGYMRMFRRVLAVVAVAAAIAALVAALAGPLHLRLHRRRVLSIETPMKPLVVSLMAAVALILTGDSFRGAFAKRTALGFYGLTAFVTWLLCLGPVPTLMGRPFMPQGPYALLMLLPGFSSLRVPARFWMMTTLCLAVIGGILFDRLARFGGNRRIATLVTALAVLADGWVLHFPIAKAPEMWNVETCDAATGTGLIELPFGDHYLDIAAMYRGMRHGRPVANGYSGYFPPHYAALQYALSVREDNVLTQLAAHGVSDVAVDSTRDPDQIWTRYVRGHAGVREVCSEQGKTLYRMNVPPAPSVVGSVIPIARLTVSTNENFIKFMLDGDLSTRWHSGPQTAGTVVDIDLGDEHTVAAVEMDLASFVRDFPRALSIEILGSDAQWKTVYTGGTAGQAFAAALEAPKQLPLTFGLDGVRARYIRLRCLSNDETYYWSIAELRVRGQ